MTDSDKTINHFHQDPKLIQQIGATTDLMIGQILYQDDDSLYKPALAINRRKSNVQGVTWSFVGKDEFYIKTEPGPMHYRFPFVPAWFAKDAYNAVYEDAVLYQYIPGLIGEKVYLSWRTPGGLEADPYKSKMIFEEAVASGFIPKYSVLIGYRTEYGLLYRPEPYCAENTVFEDEI